MTEFFITVGQAFAKQFSDPHIIVGNVLALIGCLGMVSLGLLKKKKHILIVQTGQCIFMGAGNLVLGGVPGFITNIVSIARNIFCLKWRYTIPWKIGFVAVQVVLAAIFNHMSKAGLIGWLPIIAMAIFGWFLDTESTLKLKIVLIISQAMWFVYDIKLWNIVAATFDMLTVITSISGIIIYLKASSSTESDKE